MSVPSWSRRFAVASALVGASLAPLTGTVAASGDDPSDDATVVDPGDPASAIDLPPGAVVGGTASTTTSIDVAIGPADSAVRFQLLLTASTEIDAVASDGGYTATGTFADVTLTSAGAPALGGDFALLGGAAFRQTFGANGSMLDTVLIDSGTTTDVQRRALESVIGNLQGARTIYPSEPVGVGARWSVEQRVSGDSFPVTADYQYELTAIEDGRFTISVSYSEAFDTMVDGAAATGTVSGLGSIHGSVEDPLDVSYALGQLTTTAAGGAAFDVAVTVRIESTPGAPTPGNP